MERRREERDAELRETPSWEARMLVSMGLGRRQSEVSKSDQWRPGYDRRWWRYEAVLVTAEQRCGAGIGPQRMTRGGLGAGMAATDCSGV